MVYKKRKIARKMVKRAKTRLKINKSPREQAPKRKQNPSPKPSGIKYGGKKP